MNLWIKLSFVMLMFNAVQTAFADPFDASIYEMNSNRKSLLFRQKHTETHEKGKVIARNEFSYTDGKIAAVEDVVFTEDGQFISYQIKQLQTHQSGHIEVQGDKINFSYTKDGETKTDQEKAVSNLVVGSTVVPYLMRHWDTLLKGDDVEVRYASADRKETVGFKFFKIEEPVVDGKPRIIVKMKPTSFIIAAIVKPLIFTFDKETRKLIELQGRTVPKQKVNDDWKDLDADITFNYR